MSRSFFLGAALLGQLVVPALAASAALGASALVAHESLAALPSGWSKVGSPADNDTIQLSIALALQNVDQIESRLQSVSTPGNAEYGQYLDVDDIASQFGPSNASVSAVTSWLQQAGITTLYNTGSSINFATTVTKANSLLAANFAYYSDGEATKLRTLSYSIPGNLKSDIDLVSPTTYFGQTSASRTIHSYKNKRGSKTLGKRASSTTPSPSSAVSVAASCETLLTLSCIQQLYNLRNQTASASSGSRVGFGSFGNQSARYDDLFTYEKENGLPFQNWTKVIVDNALNNQSAIAGDDGEANLDVQNIVGVSHSLPVTEFLVGGLPPYIPTLDSETNTNEPYVAYYEYLMTQSNEDLPQVISNSYGDFEPSVPYRYAVRVCNLIGLTGLRGISVLESSGDLGVGSGCISPYGNQTVFEPIFPATCPYVTAVGGTQSISPEVAWTASSGGFSSYFPRAWYQEAAVETYLTKYISDATKAYYNQYTNFAGRGFPDIAAHSVSPYYAIYYGGYLEETGGTSAASPVWAGVIALLNDIRIAADKPTLGFLNPFIYSLGYQGLTDITAGGSVGCDGVNGQTGANVSSGGIVPYASWNATVGWDPVTGLGVPDFQKLKEIVLSF